MRWASSGGIPGPLSATVISTPSRSGREATRTRPPVARRPHGVVEQVQEDLVQRRRPPQDLAAESKVAIERDPLGPVREQADGRLDPLVRVPRLEPAVGPPDVQQIADQARDLIARVDRDLHRRRVVGIACRSRSDSAGPAAGR